MQFLLKIFHQKGTLNIKKHKKWIDFQDFQLPEFFLKIKENGQVSMNGGSTDSKKYQRFKKKKI